MVFKKRNENGIYYTNFSINGKRIRVSTGTTSKTKADEYEARLKDSLWRQAKLKEKPKYTLGHAIIRYFKEVQKSEGEIEGDKTKLRFWIEALGDIPLINISSDQIEAIISDMKIIREKTDKKTGEKIISVKDKSDTTKNRYLAALRHLLKLAHDKWKWLDQIPFLPERDEPKGRLRWLSYEEAQRLLDELPLHLKEMAEFSLCTGLRQANVLDLRWNQINFHNKTISYEAPEMKGKKPLPVPLTQRALEILERQKDKHPLYVFTYEGNKLATVEHRTWKKSLERAGIESSFTWHGLRHTWASWLVQSGVSLHELMMLGGWSSYQMVLRYAHLSADHLQDAVKDFAWGQKKTGTKLAPKIINKRA